MSYFKKMVVAFLLGTFSTVVYAQNFNELSFGTDSSFDVITWNIQEFPKNGQNTLNNVSQIVNTLEAEIYALQEINDTTSFRKMVDDMDNYQWYVPPGYHQGLAYIYKKTDLELLAVYKIYKTDEYWNTFPRAPLVMEVSFSNEQYVIINNHFKCCGDGELDSGNTGDEEYRRYKASSLLKDYIDENFANENVIMLGDLNDELTDASANNVFKMFLNDSSNYRFADMEIAEGSVAYWSYPSWPSHLDHILITNELFDQSGTDLSNTETLRIGDYMEGGMTAYNENVSDHRPVGARFASDVATNVNFTESPRLQLETFPNPFRNILKINLPSSLEKGKIEVYNINGEKIHSSKTTKNKGFVRWDSSKFPNGIYFIRLLSNGRCIAQSKVLKIN